MDLIIKILVCSVLLDHNFGQDTSTQQSTVSTPPPPLLPAYDVKNLPSELRPLAFLVGKWRSDFDGKIRFPTIPVFTYGEELDISIAEKTFQGPPALNYR
uniref:THAP4-like heme-binding beta-barrel domain-containing protein n=1 Tax=Romanomermis culicivorax TaxID=13658 RepID=A0A915I737_ROMCU